MNPFLLGVSAAVLHELSHIAMARMQGLKVKRAGITWKGPYIVREAGTPEQNLRVCLAGPAANLLLAFVCSHIAPVFAFCNVVLGAYNLLPIPGSDGLRAWRLLPMRRNTPAQPVATIAAQQ
jgi:Zn-dependent protease